MIVVYREVTTAALATVNRVGKKGFLLILTVTNSELWVTEVGPSTLTYVD